MKNLQVSCEEFTVWVQVDAAWQILDGAPLVKEFVGQEISVLLNWISGIHEWLDRLVEVAHNERKPQKTTGSIAP